MGEVLERLPKVEVEKSINLTEARRRKASGDES
jgi:hypothetical protein